MSRGLVVVAVVALLNLVVAAKAEALRGVGNVICDSNGNGVIDELADTPLAGVRVTASRLDGTLVGEALTDSTGRYAVLLPEYGTYRFAIDVSTIPGGAPVLGAGVPWALTYGVASMEATIDPDQNAIVWYLIDGKACAGGECWMTAGGVKFDPILGLPAAENGPRESFGGNVYPGCNADNGNEGGQWNHVSHVNMLHFQGRQIQVVSCGNVTGIEPGSTSPVTPFNYIEFKGTGRLVGIKGNKVDYGDVEFFARVEDRGEPGNEKANKGPTLDTDRYFLRVFNSANPSLLLVDNDGNPATVDPLTITGGNLQLHFNPCPEQ